MILAEARDIGAQRPPGVGQQDLQAVWVQLHGGALVANPATDGARADLLADQPLDPVDEGQRLIPGTFLARVAKPDVLKAELRIPETQAKDVQIGQIASIDTRNGLIPGRVSRIDPAVEQGSVLVDVKLDVDEGGLFEEDEFSISFTVNNGSLALTSDAESARHPSDGGGRAWLERES